MVKTNNGISDYSIKNRVFLESHRAYFLIVCAEHRRNREV